MRFLPRRPLRDVDGAVEHAAVLGFGALAAHTVAARALTLCKPISGRALLGVRLRIHHRHERTTACCVGEIFVKSWLDAEGLSVL